MKNDLVHHTADTNTELKISLPCGLDRVWNVFSAWTSFGKLNTWICRCSATINLIHNKRNINHNNPWNILLNQWHPRQNVRYWRYMHLQPANAPVSAHAHIQYRLWKSDFHDDFLVGIFLRFIPNEHYKSTLPASVMYTIRAIAFWTSCFQGNIASLK